MKKIACYFSATALIMSLSIACTKETDQPQNNSTETPDVVVPEGTPVVMKVTIPGDMTRVSVNQDTDPDGAILLAWEDTDVIRVINHDDATVAQEFEICEGFTAHNASFAGTHFNADSYDILYGAESVSDAQTEDYTEQVQTGNGSTAHIQYMACLTGVDTYSDVEFSSEWAEAHGGNFKENSILRVRVQLPDNVASVKSVTVTAGEALSYTLTFENPADVSADHILVAYMELPWENIEIPTGTDIAVSVETANHDVYHRDDVPAGGSTLAMGKVNAVKINCNTPGTNVVLDDFAGGEGTASSPWLVGNARQLQNIQASLVSGEKKYFKMIDDVNMKGIAWTPLNNESPYDKAIDFDGDSKTVSNFTCNAASMPSFAGVLNGSVKNVTFKDAVVGAEGVGCAGVVAGGVANNTVKGTISAVTVDGSSVMGKDNIGVLVGYAGELTVTGCDISNTGVNASGAGVGGICGYAYSALNVENCTISVAADKNVAVSGTQFIGGIAGRAVGGGLIKNCSVGVAVNGSSDNVGGIMGANTNKAFDVENCCMLNDVSGKNNVAGIVGSMTVSGSSVKNCYSSGVISAVSSSTGLTGGIAANFAASTISCCYATGSVSGVRGQIGGIVGQANTTPTVEKCIAWNSSISVSGNAAGRYSCAAVVGVMFPLGNAEDCVRKSGFAISGLYEAAETETAIYDMNGIFDQDNVTADAPLKNNIGVSVTNNKIGSPYKFPYHGKEAGVSETLSDVATRLGWDATVWDLSGNEPKLNTLK